MKTFWQQLKSPILALAPMDGVTDSAFRQICQTNGADVVYTEFISSDALMHNARKALEKMRYVESERPVICQIFGHDREAFVAAAKLVQAKGFDGIDINFGCPAKCVVRHGSGVALLREPHYCRELIESILDIVKIPLSIKVRTSIRKERKEVDPTCEDRVTALDLVAAIKDLPVAAIMVHGRSYEQGHKGGVDAAMIRQVKEGFPGLVLANGGIYSPKDAKRMLEETAADGVGIARGAQGQPWIFQQTADFLTNGSYEQPTWSTVVATMLEHLEMAVQAKGHHGLFEMRKHLAWYVRGFPGAADMRSRLVRAESIEEIRNLLSGSTAEPVSVLPKASLIHG